MNIQCIDNAGFEDLLTLGKSYKVTDSRGYSIQLHDDSGQLRWYGRFKFSDPLRGECGKLQAA